MKKIIEILDSYTSVIERRINNGSVTPDEILSLLSIRANISKSDGEPKEDGCSTQKLVVDNLNEWKDERKEKPAFDPLLSKRNILSSDKVLVWLRSHQKYAIGSYIQEIRSINELPIPIKTSWVVEGFIAGTTPDYWKAFTNVPDQLK